MLQLILGSADSNISAEELNFAKYIISLQKRFALGLLDGLITHLKFKGLWDLYKLTRSKLDVIISPPVEYQQYRRQHILEAKLTMLKSVVGEEAAGKLFSEAYALEYFMGWDKDQIKRNAVERFAEQVQHAKEEALIEKVKTTGTIDFKDEEMGLSESLKEILLKDISEEESAEGGESEGGDDSGDEFDMGDSGVDDFESDDAGDDFGRRFIK